MKYAGRSLAVLLVIGYALFVAGGLTFYFALHDHPVERYRDIVVGGVSWIDANKSSDFRYLYSFLALLAITTFAGAGTVRLLSRKSAGRRWKEAVCVTALLGLLAATAILLGLAGPWLWVSLGLSCCLAVALARQDVLGTDGLPIAGLGIALLGMAFFAGLGIAAFLGRWLPPQPAMQEYLLALPVIMAVAAAAFVLACLVFSRGVASLRRFLEAGILAAQLGIPLCYSVFLPAHLRTPDGIFTLASPPWLRVLVLVPIAGAWWQVWKIYSAWKRSKGPSEPLDRLLSTLCAGAAAVYISVYYERVPYLSSDHFHIGEMLLPWQQFLHFHSVPYVNFAPVHGLMAYAYGFLASAFLDSTSASFLEAQRFLYGIGVLITVWAARPLCGAFLAIACAIPLVTILDRDIFLAAAVFVLVNPKTVSQPLKWLLACAGVCAFSLAFNIPVGAAVTLSAAVPAAYTIVRWWRGGRQGFTYGRLAILAVLIALVLVFAFPVIRGWIWFATDNESTNVIANGMRFRPSLGDLSANGALFNLFNSKTSAEALLREAWVLVSVWGFYALFLQMRQPKAERKPEGLLAAWFIAVLPIAMSAYTFVRIELGGPSRSGPITFILVATVLPVLTCRILPPFKPLPFLIAGYALIAFFMPEKWYNDLKDFRYKAATLTDMMTYPPGQRMVAGIAFGLPSIGRVSADAATLNEITRLKHALSLLLRPDETYLDLTNRQALFYYLDLPIPQLYVPYLAASEKMQERMIKQWRADPPPAVLAAPAEGFDGGPVSLRCYRFYRELAFAYNPIELDGFTFLVDPKRLPAPGYARPVRLGLLDSVFLVSDLRGLPSAWGKSWKSLESRFKKIAEAPMTVDPSLTGAPSISPVASFDLKSLALTGAEADFGTVEFDLQTIPGQPDAAIVTSWTSASEPNPPKVSCGALSPVLLLPLGAQPRWLLSDRLETFRIELVNPSSVRTFKIKKLTLWKLNDFKLDSSVAAGQDKFRPRFNHLRSWAVGPTSTTQAELAKSVRELSSNMTFTLPSNTLAAAIIPSLIKRPDGKYGLFAHAPAQVFLPLEERKQTLSFGFGILPSAYTNGNKTDGVIFKLWLQKSDGVKTLLWSRLLNPLEEVKDRDTQWTKMTLDPPKGARLILETDPNHNMYWDWAYWEDVRIE
jgi:hypothetical protein